MFLFFEIVQVERAWSGGEVTLLCISPFPSPQAGKSLAVPVRFQSSVKIPMLTFVYGVFFQCQLYLEMHVILMNKEHRTTYYDLYLYFYSFKVRMRLFLIVLVFRSKSKSKCFHPILTLMPYTIFRNRKCQLFMSNGGA